MKTNVAIGNRPWVRSGAMALVAVGLVSLAACTGGSAPIVTETPSPTVTASPAPSPSPSPTPLTDAELLALMPPEAAYPDVRGAIATAQFFTEQYSLMFQTGDLQVVRALSGEQCLFCAEAVSTATDEAAAGDFESGGDVTYDATQVRANLHTGDGFTYVDFPYVQGPTTVHHADGSIEVTDPGSSGRVYYRMGLVDNVWHVVGAEVRSE
jgi:Family of unknown function (DUF6318)